MRRGILAGRDQLRALSDRISICPFDSIFHALERRCALILEARPITETQWRATWERGSWCSALLAARATQGRIMDLAIAHHVDTNSAYRDRAIEELRNLCSWSTWVDPCHNRMAADICTSEAAVAAVIGLDWLWEDIADEDRDQMVQNICDKALRPYVNAVEEKVWWHSCYHHWNAVVNAGVALAAMVLEDEDPIAAKAEELARGGLRNFFDALGRDGGWDEGTGYWGQAIRYLLLLAEADRNLRDDLGIYHARGMDQTGLFPVYFTPNGHTASFGEMPGEPLHGAIYLLVKQFGLMEVAWWLDTYALGRDATTSGWSAAGLAMLFRPDDIDVGEDPRLDEVKTFPEIGWAAMADRWPRPDLYVAVKTGDLAANHSQCNMNAIQLQLGGEMMLVDISRNSDTPRHGTPDQNRFYEISARAHNTICTAERDHQIDAQGSIIESAGGRKYRWLTCDAGAACGENTRFIRHIVMAVDPKSSEGRSVIVLDELTNGSPEKFELMWHTLGQVDADRDAQRGTITGVHSTLHFALAATVRTALHLKSASINAHRSESILHVTGGAMGRVLLLSVFSPKPIKGEVGIEESPRSVTVIADGVKARFKASRSHLRLGRVES